MKINSKLVTLSVMAGMLLSSVPAMAQDNDIIEVYVNNEQVVFDVNPIIENERTLVPLRAIFEALGAEVTWDQETRTASATRGTDTVSITIDSNVLYKNGNAVELDVPAKIVDERTLVPVRAISESFDAEVTWVQETQSVYIVTIENNTTDSAENKTLITLSDADMQILTSIKEDIRYDFEQAYLPQVLLTSETLYEDMASVETIGSIIEDYWFKNVNNYIIYTMIESETNYVLDATMDIEASFIQFQKDLDIDFKSVVKDITTVETTDGMRLAVIEFKSAAPIDPLKIQCKYIGIIQSKDGEPRYFTAESDPFQTETWYFCEVTSNSRGTILLFEKVDEETDLDTFINIMGSVYVENVPIQTELKVN